LEPADVVTPDTSGAAEITNQAYVVLVNRIAEISSMASADISFGFSKSICLIISFLSMHLPPIFQSLRIFCFRRSNTNIPEVCPQESHIRFVSFAHTS
jgi:hypothetical protein